MKYPKTLTEQRTLDLILEGKSIARYGDGEFKICMGRQCVSQVYDEKLDKEMRRILKEGNTNHCLVGIPNAEQTAKEHWSRFLPKPIIINMLNDKVEYASSFITRPDSAPSIDTQEYWDKVHQIWEGKDVVLVKGSDRSLRTDRLPGVKSVTIVETPYRDAYQEIDRIEREIMAIPHTTVLLCVGATATCLAHRLSKRGKHALDLGHIGMFMKYKLTGKYHAEQSS